MASYDETLFDEIEMQVNQEPTHIFDLPEEIILGILVYLPMNDLLLGVSLVCRYWKELAEKPELWRRIDQIKMPVWTTDIAKRLLIKSNNIHSINMRPCKRIDASVFSLMAKQSKLQTLALERCRYSAESLLSVTKVTPLKHLSITRSLDVTDDMLVRIADSCKSLVSLDISYCINITAVGLRAMLVKCTKLKHLKMNGCKLVDLGFLNKIETGIHTLEIGSCTFHYYDWQWLGKLPNLVQLNASYTLMDSCMVASLSNLVKLDLEGCEKIRVGGTIEIIVRRNPNLEWLNLKECFINDEDICVIAKSSCHLTLKVLIVDDIRKLSSIELVLRNCKQLVQFCAEIKYGAMEKLRNGNPDLNFRSCVFTETECLL